MLNMSSKNCNPPVPTDKNDEVLRYILSTMMMRVGMNEIAEKNWKEFYARLHMVELQIGGGLIVESNDKGPVNISITPTMVKRWIGLYTNASKFTEAQFLKTFSNSLRDFEQECE